MTPQQAGGLFWTESKFFAGCAARSGNESTRKYYERLAKEANQDRQEAEKKVKTNG